MPLPQEVGYPSLRTLPLAHHRPDLMKYPALAAFAALATLPMCWATQQAALSQTSIVVSASAHEVEKLAASELSRYLSRLYPDESFPLVPDADGRRIIVGTPDGSPGLRDLLGERAPVKPESFVVTHAGGVAIVAGADPRGTLYGVYALL